MYVHKYFQVQVDYLGLDILLRRNTHTHSDIKGDHMHAWEQKKNKKVPKKLRAGKFIV